MGKLKILILPIFLIILTGCSSKSEDLTLVLDWTPNTNHTGFVVAIENGYYEEEGLSLKIIQPYEDGAIPIVSTGKAQFGISSQEEIGYTIDSGNSSVISIATILGHNTSGIISLKEKDIKNFKDLENKTYATWGTLPFEQAILKQVIEDDGGSFEKLNLYYSTVTDTFSALKNNIDAVWVFEGWDVCLAKNLGIDINFIKFKDVNPILDYYTPILIANKNFIENNKEKVIKFLKATKKGYEFASKNPEKSAEILLKYFPEIDKDLALESQKYLANQYITEDGWGLIDSNRWNNFFKWAYEKGITTKYLEDLGFTNEFIFELEKGEA